MYSMKGVLTRRTMLQSMAATATTFMTPALKPRSASAAAPYRVVVAGGGFAGATAAKYLKLWGQDNIEVTLVDPKRRHVSCVMSNLVLDRTLGLNDLKHDLSKLQDAHGLTYRRDTVESVDPDARTVGLKSGDALDYDKLVLTGGISFRKPKGLSYSEIPHAWIAGGQTVLLRNQIEDMPDGGAIVLGIPKAPYRCPPGPYERACTFASLLRQRGGGRVIVLDANAGITAERETFTRAFFDLYSDIIDYHTDVAIKSVNSSTRQVETNIGPISGDVVNIIPDNRASALVRKAGLAPKGSDWAPVDPLSYASTLPGLGDIHVIGDSQGTGQPKSGHMANAQAKVCADAIVRLLNGESIDTPERKAAITTNSACFSPITADEASWLTAAFAYNADTDQMQLVPGSLAEARRWSRENYRDMFTWSQNLWADSFR